MKKLKVARRDCAGFHQCVEVDHPIPIVLTVDDDAHAFGQLLRLGQRQQLEQFVKSAKAARENHQGLRQVCEPQLAHEEVMELEIQLRSDIRVRNLFERQIDIHA